ncbi:MAG: type IX secretion system sortase PorU [Paludibacteraceae bacterium]|nr:type IX secretion system sortase PorU [Paludibacteraceae bacterium]
MKRLLPYVLLLFTLTAWARPAVFYRTSSLLREGNIVRLQVNETGIYCVTYEQIVSWGLNPAQISVLGYGGALLSQDFTQPRIDDLCSVAFYMEKGSDGKFGAGDYLLFYGQGSVSWQFNGSYYVHTRNHCSDYGYYFLSDAPGLQNVMTTADALTPEETHDVTSYRAYALHEEELVNLVDRQKGMTGGGREFYGESISPDRTESFSFSIDNVLPDQEMTFQVAAASTAKAISMMHISSGIHQVELAFPVVENNDNYTSALTGSRRLSQVPGQKTPTLSLRFTSESTADLLYLNYIELNAECALRLETDYLLFRQPASYGDNTYSRYCLTQADANTQIWDVTQLDHIKRIPTQRSNDTLFFIGEDANLRQYVAVRTTGREWLQPTFVEKVPNQSLHSLRDIDYVIITPAEFRSEALRLAQAHYEHDGLTYAVVTDREVYNEFSSGTPDVSAYRWFLKMLYDCASNEQSRPKSLLLFGDGTFDNRQLLPYSGKNTLLTYQAVNSTVEPKAYATDDYFAFMDDNAGMVGSYFSDPNGVMHFGVGRLPVSTITQATDVVNKLIAYMEDKGRGAWKQQLCFLADDGDHNQHTSISDEAAELVRVKCPKFIVNKVYLDAYTQETSASGERYPLAYNRFKNLMQQGILFMDYSGHGSANNITNEMFLTKTDIEQMNNPHPTFWMLATCGFAHFDQRDLSATELAVLNPKGGAIGVVSACRTVYANENKNINKYLCDTLFGHNDPYHYSITIGEATRIAKNRCGKSSENKLSYILLGDPAIRLNYPTQYDVVTTILSDTLRALQEVTIGGYIRDEQGDTAHMFNGIVTVSIYDKLQQITTRDNDAISNGQTPIPYTFNDYPNLLFAGSTKVEDGLFQMHFRMPKDIRYNYGNGRIVYYAIDSLTQDEGLGYDHSFVIGGSDATAALIVDTIGPDVHLYMENAAFRDGGKTSENPHFYADIYDENGINAVGSGIGHDLMLVVDNDAKQTYSLNNYFTTINNSYRQGQVSYALPQLTEGQHSLLFRAWDLLNNSTTATLRFNVVKGLKTVLYSVTAYPNPCPSGGTMTIRVSADRPDEQLTTVLSIYNLSGQKLFSESFEGNRTLSFTPSQMNMQSGIYIYRIECQTPTSGTSTASGKLIVL